MNACPECSSVSVHRKGHVLKDGKIQHRYRCTACGENFYDPNALPPKTPKLNPPKKEKLVKLTKPQHTGRTWVITCATNDVPVNWKFFETLETYCDWNNAQLIIVPVKYQQGLNEDGGYSWPEVLKPYFVNSNISLCSGLRLLAGTRVAPAIGNPLTGFECFSKGDSLILPHAQLQMRTVAMSHVDPSAVLTTTGSITEPRYTATKQGEKASFNHSYSAIVAEEDKEHDCFHLRVLNSDETGAFYDVDRFYDGLTVKANTDIPAVILGDEHIIHSSEKVTAATFTNTDSIVNVLRPELIVRHDSLDFYSSNHHHSKNTFTQYAKFISGKNNSADELALTVEYVLKTTPDFATSVIVSSNHNEHFTRWIQECNPKLEPWNAILYHEMMAAILKKTTMGATGALYPNPFELWARSNYNMPNVRFVSPQESFKVKGIELAFHGDRGTNGSRGSAPQFSKLGTKCVVGHSHSPQIFGGAYQVGHSCEARLEYNLGASSWAEAHCIIQPNGKRQMLFIIRGRWRR